MMSKICDHRVYSPLKLLFKAIIKRAFVVQFDFHCPRSLHTIRDLSFVPHLIGVNCYWKDIKIDRLFEYLAVPDNDQERVLRDPGAAIDAFPRLEEVGGTLVNYRLQIRQAIPTRLKSIFSWNINSWSHPNCVRQDPKTRRCKKLLRSGPVLLQETKWQKCRGENIIQHLAGTQVASSPAIPTDKDAWSGGVAIITPAGWQIESEYELLQGRAVAVLVRDRTAPFYLISVCLRPNNTQQELSAILRAWKNIDHPTDKVVIAGDFNHADEKCPETWRQFLRAFQLIDVHPTLATYHFAGKTFPLDRYLVPESWVTTARWNPVVSTLQSTQTSGHNIIKLSPMVRPVVLNNPRDMKHETISTEVFMPGKDGRVVQDNHQLNRLIRILHYQHQLFRQSVGTIDGFRLGASPGGPTPFPCKPQEDGPYRPERGHSPPCKRRKTACRIYDPSSRNSMTDDDIQYHLTNIHPDGDRESSGSEDEPECSFTWAGQQCPEQILRNGHLKFTACYWSWWRSHSQNDSRQSLWHQRPFLRAKKFAQTNAEWVNVPTPIVEDLIKESHGAVLCSLNGLVLSRGSVSLPRVHLQEMLEVIESFSTKVPYVPCDEANAQARGLGSMVAFWERMRNVCPKVNVYNGPIYRADGHQCITSDDLDDAMLSTRNFWFCHPTEIDHGWDQILSRYEQSEPWPEVCLPNKEDLLNTLLHTRDSAPGPDGLPYAAWRLLPEVTVEAMASFFFDIMEGTALPPLQVGVWIPKAKMGPEADCFRPLGMPDTLARLVDGTVAAKVMHATAQNMHPSQTVMSMFKEPQRAVSGIQNILDSTQAACTLLADLSKAFERVNPHWILRILHIKGAPTWVIKYTRHVLFHRRVRHKVQGRLLPSRTILQGVDMGRSFSVFLFCLAMDPLFHYLNRIPDVLSVQAYVDDTTVIGDAQNLDWVGKVSDCYQKLSSAGFIIEPHQCFRCCANSVMKFLPRYVTDEYLAEHWPELIQGKPFATIHAALQAASRPGYNIAIVRLAGPVSQRNDAHNKVSATVAEHLLANYSFDQSREIRQGREVHSTLAFVKAKCSCKSKSHVVTNYPLRASALCKLERSTYGIQSITSHAPSLGLALCGRWTITEQGSWKEVQPPDSWKEMVPAPCKKYQQRIDTFRGATLSVTARCTAYNTFIISVMPYTASYFGLSTTDLNTLRQSAVKYILRRHWLEAEIMPYVFRLVGIAPLMDPALAATVAALGLYLREGNTVEDLVNYTSFPTHCNLRQRSIVLDLLRMWEPYVKFESLVRVLTEKAGGPRKKLDRVKEHIISSMKIIARTRLIKKIREEGWTRGISPEWVEIVSGLSNKWCNGVSRFSLLRWAVNQDDDVWLQRRGTRHCQRCSMCGNPGETFPDGYNSAPLCENCTQTENLTPIEVCPYGATLQVIVSTVFRPSWQWHSPSEEIDRAKHLVQHEGIQKWQQFANTIKPISMDTCRACGCGDNSVGHWTRWCVVPLLTAWILLCPEQPLVCLNAIACTSPRAAAVCTLVVAAFRRLLRQEGSFVHQTPAEPKSVWWWIEHLLSEVSQNATQELHMDFFSPSLITGHCLVRTEGIVPRRVMPLDLETMHLPPMVCTTASSGNNGDRVALLPFESVALGILKEMRYNPPASTRNCRLKVEHCPCGEYHVGVYLTQEVMDNDMLFPEDYGDAKLLAQFDGSAHRECHIGGAGACLYLIASSGLQLIEWGSLALPRCSDNVEAETYGAELALRLYEQYVRKCSEFEVPPLPLDRIQGDIKPLITHLQFQSRFRRKDLIPIIDRFFKKRSRIAPLSMTEYRPREANFVSDYLAGQGSQKLLSMVAKNQCLPTTPVWVDIDPPYDLLLDKGATIVGNHVGGKLVIALQEQVSCTMEELATIAQSQPLHVQRWLRQIAVATARCTKSFCVEYIASHQDGMGRLYTQQASGQQLPKVVRKLVYGRSHKEVDMSGAHYEIIRRLVRSDSLPPIKELRTRLYAAWSPHVSSEQEGEVKLFPMRVINMGASLTISHYQGLGMHLPAPIVTIAYDLELARDTVRNEWAHRIRPHAEVDYTNRNYFVLEEIEQRFMVSFLRELQTRTRSCSVIWLHDGIWIQSSVPNSVLQQAELQVARSIGLPVDLHNPIMRIHDLHGESDSLWAEFGIEGTVGSYPPLFPIPLKVKPPQFTPRHPKPVYSKKRIYPETSRIHFARRAKARRCR